MICCVLIVKVWDGPTALMASLLSHFVKASYTLQWYLASLGRLLCSQHTVFCSGTLSSSIISCCNVRYQLRSLSKAVMIIVIMAGHTTTICSSTLL